MNLIFVKLIGDHLKTFEFFSRFSPLVTNLLAGLYTVNLTLIGEFPGHELDRITGKLIH